MKPETSSVARQRTSASGMTARQFRTKTAESPHPRTGANTPIGTNASINVPQFFKVYVVTRVKALSNRQASVSLKTGGVKET